MSFDRKADGDRARDGRRTDMAASAGRLARWTSNDDTPRTRRLLRLGPSEGDPSEKLARQFFRDDPLVIYDGESWRLSPDGTLKRWDAAARRWESIRPDDWSRDIGIVIDDHAEAETPPSAEPTGGDEVWASLAGCTFVGGTLQELCLYGKYTIAFGHEAITMLSRQGGVVEIPCSEVVDVEIGGRGRVTDVTEGERFAFERAQGEVAATTVVKSLVARAGMDTSIRIETAEGEAYFHCDSATPDEIRESLGSFLAGVRRASGKDVGRHAELSGRLAKLADLRNRGLLTEEEFSVAIGTVIGDEG